MLRITLLVFFAFISAAGYTQNCDKTVEWDIDDNSIKKELPYNQSICLKLKSKKIHLDKIDHIFILEHKGPKTSDQSLDYYANHKNRIQRKFYTLKKGEYDSENRTLEVKLIEIKVPDSIRNKKLEPAYVLHPSKNYTIYLLNSDLDNLGTAWLDSTSAYIYFSRQTSVDSVRLRQVKHNLDSIHMLIHQNITTSAGGKFHSVYTSDTLPDILIREYERSIYKKYDSVIARLSDEQQRFLQRQQNDLPILKDTILPYLEKNLNIVTKQTCISKFPCDVNNCDILKILLCFESIDSTSIINMVQGNLTLGDLINPNFVLKKKTDGAAKVKNLDSSILQFYYIKLYLHSLVLSDCPAYTCCDSTKPYSNAIIRPSIINYQGVINRMIDTLNRAKELLVKISQLNSERLIKVKSKDFFYITSKMNAGNTYTYGLEPRNKLNIIPVFGYAFYGFQKSFNSFTPYTGILVSFSPLNDDVPFRLLKHKTLAQRLTFMTAVTLSSLKEDNKRDNLFSNGSNLMVGLGLKLSHVLTFNGGAVIFKKEDPNPFVTTKKIATTPFASLSINLKLETLFKGLIGLIPGK